MLLYNYLFVFIIIFLTSGVNFGEGWGVNNDNGTFGNISIWDKSFYLGKRDIHFNIIFVYRIKDFNYAFTKTGGLNSRGGENDNAAG